MLAGMDDLPSDYIEAMGKAGVTPLWPSLRNLLPYGEPTPISQATHWGYENLRPLLLRAGELTPVEKAERRVLVLCDEGRGAGAMQATATLYAGLQLLLPGEAAPAHRHTPSAARIIVEGKGGFTVVDGEKLPMEDGDLVLTPGGLWHDHGHDGDEPVVWLDALDLPLFVYLEGSYSEESPLQAPGNRKDKSQVEYLSSGVVPLRNKDALPNKFPMLRFPWKRTEESLRELAELGGVGDTEVEFINPETGGDVLPAIGFSALLITDQKPVCPPKRSSSALYHVVKGRGRTKINGQEIHWGPKDTFSAPVFASIEHIAESGEAFLYHINDRPLQEKLGYYEERA